MPWTKEDRAFKILINKRVTSSGKKYYEEFGDNTLDISFSEIKTQKTPYNNPNQGIMDGVVKAYNMFVLTEDLTVLPAQTAYYAYDPLDLTKNDEDRLKYWIGDKYGKSYTLKLYDNNENEITPTACDWFFDYTTGILTFDGSVPNYAKPYKVKGFRYIGKLGGKIGGGFGQKELYDLDFFPGHESEADNHVPVYNAATDRYELKPYGSDTTSTTTSIEVVTKRFDVFEPQTLFTVDTVLVKVIFVTVNGIVQTEGIDYTVSGRDITFTYSIGNGKHVVIHYFKSMNATVVVEGDVTVVEALSYESLDFDGVNRTLNLVAPNPANSIMGNIMTIFDYKFSNSWTGSRIYKYGDYVFHQGSLYYSLKTGNNENIEPTDGDDWLLLLKSGDGATIEVSVSDENINSTRRIIVPQDNKMVLLNFTAVTDNGQCSVDILGGLSENHTVRIYPTYGTTITFNEGANIYTEGALGALLVGANGDWIEFLKRNGGYYQMNGGFYGSSHAL